MNLNIIAIILSLISACMFITIFVVVLKIWNLQKDVLESGGYPTVIFSRAKRDGKAIIDGRAAWDYNKDEIIRILSRYPDDAEAVNLISSLKDQGSASGEGAEIPQDINGAASE